LGVKGVEVLVSFVEDVEVLVYLSVESVEIFMT